MPISSVELSVVLPALDESENLQVLLPKLIETLKALGASYEIIVVDGGSDGTAAVVEASGVRLLRQAGKGYGSALHEGLQAAGGRWILTMDADGSHPPEAVARLWALRQSGELVAASRFCAGGSAQMPGWRYWISRLLNLGTGLLLGLPLEDASSGYRLYDAKTVKGLAPVARDFSAQQEIVAGVMRGGGRVLEIPFHYSPRGRGVSKARMSWAFSYLRTFARVLGILHGRAAVPALLAAVSLAGAAGLWGLRWGVPDRGRLRVLPARLQPTPEVARRFADQWRKLYEEIGRAHDEMKPEEPVTYVEGVEIVEPGWDFPPPKLANSYRSFLLQSEHPDEKKAFIILAQMRPWKLDLKPLYLQYGGSFVYPLGAFLKAGAVLGLLTLDPDPAYYMAHPQAMGRLYVAARLFILFFHLGAVGLIVLLGLRL